MSGEQWAWVLLFVIGAANFGAIFLLFRRHFRTIGEDEALVVSTLQGTRVSFSSLLIVPFVHKAEVMDLTLQSVEIERRGRRSVRCADDVRAEMTVTFFVRVNKTQDDVLKVAESVGCARAADPDRLAELLGPRFSQAVEVASADFDFEALFEDRRRWRERVMRTLGPELSGYVLEDVVMEAVEPMPADARETEERRGAGSSQQVEALSLE